MRPGSYQTDDAMHLISHCRCFLHIYGEPHQTMQQIVTRWPVCGGIQYIACSLLNTAVRVVSGTRKVDRGLSQLLHSELHWLDIPQRVQYKRGVRVHRCSQNKAPQYLIDYCTSTSDDSSHQRLRSANRHQLTVPRHRRSTFGRRRAFSVAGPMKWNSLPHSLRDPVQSTNGFRSALKTHLFAAQRDD